MFFIVIIAALLYVYRYFRKIGAAVSSRYVEPGPGPATPLRLAGSLETRLGVSDASRTALWDGRKRVGNGELQQLVRRVARAAGAAGVERGAAVALEQPAGATPLALAVAQLAGVHLGAAGGRTVTGAQVQQWLEGGDEPAAAGAKALGEDALEATELEGALEGLVLGARDSVRHATTPSRAARRVLRWQAGGGGAAVGLLGCAEPVSAEASVLLLSPAELMGGAARLHASLEKGGILRRWALQQAVALAASCPADSLWSRMYLQTKLIIADTLYFPAAVAAGFGPRAVHLLVAREDGPIEPGTSALLRSFNLQIHTI
jgi:hypothetical protein